MVEVILEVLILIALLFLIIIILKKENNKQTIDEIEQIKYMLSNISNDNKSLYDGIRNTLSKLDHMNDSKQLNAIYKRLGKLEKKVGHKNENKV